ncbi:hypothetical protein NNJEOMEG_02005 [Fundidesulfovibrio magnetotacticus]|uniref:Methyltransferase type 11 domain-containing protein n=1 Tax=Fundidesulfovibrio magnetotacticus TaxID=2730080 RepID=A0A6V8M129_9BACT|nr:DUF268 domain-containing protein [Fundidesulfovibrio magnetotacticus]GFK94165.1 hypothetical protein NNJEOMEG_02005 [Fundidesulfovibrio magnetotacticus]
MGLIDRYVLPSLNVLARERRLKALWREWRDYFATARELRRQLAASGLRTPLAAERPCLGERTESSGRFGRYIYQDSWAFSHVLRERPEWMADVASSRYFVGFAAQAARVVSVDLRNVDGGMENFQALKADILALPFGDGSVPLVSSLSVLEHVGLGRYGDAPDVHGMARAAREMARVARPGGLVLAAFPAGREDRIVYNAHRVLTPESSRALFAGLDLVDERYALGDRICTLAEYDRLGRPYAYGCYAFRKP